MNYVALLRPAQWIKNAFIFIPLFFAGHLFETIDIFRAAVVFLSFSLMASAIYSLNDIRDVESDRRHPVKCRRPLASGKVSLRTAWSLFVFLPFASIALLLFLPMDEFLKVCAVELIYLLLNIVYCFWLKYISIVDVFVIAIGFVLRVIAGGIACAIWLSPWIICLTFLIALFLAFSKRRDDVFLQNQTGETPRKSIEGYSLAFLDMVLAILAAVTIVCYLLYTVSSDTVQRVGSEYIYITSIFVIAAILRYLMLALVLHKSGSPTTVVYRDRFIQLCIICWIASYIILIYV